MQPLRVVLTGGPAGGKTTAIGMLAKHYREKGYSVYTSPEVPTLLHHCGVNLREKMANARDQENLLQGALHLQTSMECLLYHLAETDNSDKRPLILFDRGVIDFKGYYTSSMWERVTQRLDIDRDYEHYCYDLVLHLVTTAIGAEAFFNNDNPARQCSLELAQELDRRTRNTWRRKVVEIDNSTDFLGKVTRIISQIDIALSEPV